MDTDTLVDNRLDDGQKLVEELTRRGFPVAAAFWIKPTIDDKWRFYIVSPVVDAAGILEAYGQLHPLVRAMPQPFGINPLKIKLIGPSDPLARDVLVINHRTAQPHGGPIRWPGIWLGNLSIEGAYLYFVPTSTAS